jgi:hypothetical protein
MARPAPLANRRGSESRSGRGPLRNRRATFQVCALGFAVAAALAAAIAAAAARGSPIPADGIETGDTWATTFLGGLLLTSPWILPWY